MDKKAGKKGDKAVGMLRSGVDSTLAAMKKAVARPGAFSCEKDSPDKVDTKAVKEYVGALCEMEKLVRAVYGTNTETAGDGRVTGVVILAKDELTGADERAQADE